MKEVVIEMSNEEKSFQKQILTGIQAIWLKLKDKLKKE